MNLRATSATFLFFVFAVVSLLIPLPHREPLWPFAIFYLALLLNTYFSIDYFSEIIPTDVAIQRVADATLVLCYAGLAVTMGYPLFFALFLLCLYIVATLKYWSAEGVVEYPNLLTRKVKFDFIGILMGVLYMLAVLFGVHQPAVIILDLCFIAANIYLFLVRPLYKAPVVERYENVQ